MSIFQALDPCEDGNTCGGRSAYFSRLDLSISVSSKSKYLGEERA